MMRERSDAIVQATDYFCRDEVSGIDTRDVTRCEMNGGAREKEGGGFIQRDEGNSLVRKCGSTGGVEFHPDRTLECLFIVPPRDRQIQSRLNVGGYGMADISYDRPDLDLHWDDPKVPGSLVKLKKAKHWQPDCLKLSMYPRYSFLRRTVLAGTLFILATGCAVRARYYDAPHSDYHRWRAAERGPYSRWEAEQHRSHEDYRRMREQDRQAYWNWRHDHP